jgi:hypothetical protein
VLVTKRRLGFGAEGRQERFVVLQSDAFRDALDTVVVVPLDEALPIHETDPLALRLANKEVRTGSPQFALVALMTSARLDRFERSTAGRLRSRSLLRLGALARILLDC